MNDKPWEIRKGDCRDGLDELEPEICQLVVTSPPYAQGLSYEVGLDWQGLFDLIWTVAPRLLRVVKPGGFAFVNFGETTHYYNTMGELYNECFRKAGWLMHSRRVWKKQFARCGLTGLNNVHTIPVAEYEHLWTFRKEPNDKEQIRSNLSYHAVWEASGTAKYAGHPATMPWDLAAQAIELWSDEGDLIIDPFNGVASTGVAALSLNRRYLGFELDQCWVEVSRDRLGRVQSPLLVSYSEREKYTKAEREVLDGLD